MSHGGRPILSIPGPSVMPDRVLQAMHQPAPNIYGGDLADLSASVLQDLKGVARTESYVAIYIANGHGAWEAAIANTLAPGDKVLVLATGWFGHGWAGMALSMGVEAEVIEFGKSSAIDLDRVEQALRADKARSFKAIMVTHVDTSSSALNDVAGVRAALDAVGHPALLMADCIASLGCDRFEMDDWGVDVMVAASQKGLMVPPGLGFVYFSQKAAQVRAQMERVSKYWDWVPRSTPEEFYQYFGGTAPTHHLFGLRESLDMIAEEGLEKIWARHEKLASALWAACDVWGQGGELAMNITDREHRSRAVTALRFETANASRLRAWAEKKAGVTLGIGLGMAPSGDRAWHRFFRVGHMGHVNAHMILGTLSVIETGMKALKIPHEAGGITAATEVLADVALDADG